MCARPELILCLHCAVGLCDKVRQATYLHPGQIPADVSGLSGLTSRAEVESWIFKNITQDFLIYFCITPSLPRQGRMMDEMGIRYIGAPRSGHSTRLILTHTHKRSH